MKAIFLNGPPNSGKDSLGDLIWRRSPRYVDLDFKEPLINIARRIVPVDDRIFSSRALKDTPIEAFHGLTPRQFLIKISEEWIKPTFGPDFFGKRVVEDLEYTSSDSVLIFKDSGFAHEARPIIDLLGPESCMYIKVFRQDTSWEGDSRTYWMTEAINWGLPCTIFDNRGSTFQAMEEALNNLHVQYPEFIL